MCLYMTRDIPTSNVNPLHLRHGAQRLQTLFAIPVTSTHLPSAFLMQILFYLINSQSDWILDKDFEHLHLIRSKTQAHCHWSFVVLVSADDHFHTGGLNSCFWRRSTATAIFFFFLLFERVQLRVITPMLGTERGHSNTTDLSRVRIIPLNQWYSTFHILASLKLCYVPTKA